MRTALSPNNIWLLTYILNFGLAALIFAWPPHYVGCLICNLVHVCAVVSFFVPHLSFVLAYAYAMNWCAIVATSTLMLIPKSKVVRIGSMVDRSLES